MAEEIDPIKTLKAAKDKLVEERRALAVAIALGYRRRRTDDHHTNEMREAFISIQKTLDAVDRAIEQEKLIASEQPDSFIVSILENEQPDASRFDNRQ